MKRSKWKFDEEELNVLIYALVNLKNQLIQEGRTTDAIDDLLIRLCQ